MYPNEKMLATQQQVGGSCIVNAIRPPSLEQRLDYLHRGIERVMKVRASIEYIADRVLVNQTNAGTAAAAPPATDLSGKFGDAINYLHANIDELERLVGWLEAALFEGGEKAAQAKRADR